MITGERDCLFYVLNWSLKTDFHDLTDELYDMTNPECREKSLMKEKYWVMYNQQYPIKFMEDMSIPQ